MLHFRDVNVGFFSQNRLLFWKKSIFSIIEFGRCRSHVVLVGSNKLKKIAGPTSRSGIIIIWYAQGSTK